MPESCCLRVGGELVDLSCPTAPSPGNAYLECCYAFLAPSAVPALTLSLTVVSIFQVKTAFCRYKYAFVPGIVSIVQV